MDTKRAALEVFEKYYSAWESNERRMDSGYSYESTFVEMMRKLENEVLQVSPLISIITCILSERLILSVRP